MLHMIHLKFSYFLKAFYFFKFHADGTRSHFPVPMFLRRHRRNSSHPNIPFHKENEKTEKQKISPSPKNQQLVLGEKLGACQLEKN